MLYYLSSKIIELRTYVSSLGFVFKVKRVDNCLQEEDTYFYSLNIVNNSLQYRILMFDTFSDLMSYRNLHVIVYT